MIPLPSQLRDAAKNNNMAKAQQLLDRGVNVTCAAASRSPVHTHAPVPLLGCVVEDGSLGVLALGLGQSDGCIMARVGVRVRVRFRAEGRPGRRS